MYNNYEITMANQLQNIFFLIINVWSNINSTNQWIISSYKTMFSALSSEQLFFPLLSFSWWSAVSWVRYYTNLLPAPQSCTSFIIHKRTVNLPRVGCLFSRPLAKSALWRHNDSKLSSKKLVLETKLKLKRKHCYWCSL